jgi:hypothetical protein
MEKKMKVKPYIILLLNTSRKHVNYEEDKNKVSIPMNKPYNIQNTNICNGIFHISFFKALLINEGEMTCGANRIRGETTRIRNSPGPNHADGSVSVQYCIRTLSIYSIYMLYLGNALKIQI